MTGQRHPVWEELQAYRPSDPIFGDLLKRAWMVIAECDAVADVDELHLFVANPRVASPALKASDYYTESCKALPGERTIVVNEQFFIELEAAVRSFGQAESLLGCPYLKDDPQLFGLVRRIKMDPMGYLERLRRRALRSTADPEVEEHIQQELMMVMVFFLSHELGHLLDSHSGGQFSTFVDPDASLEDRIEEAVVKLCRHVDEFTPTQFGLGGFEQVAVSTSEVRRIADEYRTRDEGHYERQEAFFDNEADADEWANRIIISYLGTLAKGNPIDAEQSLYLLARGIFVAALYTWYRDLEIFGGKLGVDSMNDARDLNFVMMRNREMYVQASSLFGEHHRFTLLRAALALEEILRARTDWFDLPLDRRSIYCKRDDARLATDSEARREWWLCESLQRYFLLCICMDTAVKIANVGCATGWIREADRERDSPQILIMDFEPINAALEHLKAMR